MIAKKKKKIKKIKKIKKLKKVKKGGKKRVIKKKKRAVPPAAKKSGNKTSGKAKGTRKRKITRKKQGADVKTRKRTVQSGGSGGGSGAGISLGARGSGVRARSSRYTSKDIEVLEGLEPVRTRPAMYIGGTDAKGLHQLVWEILDNAVDEVINGYASRIEVVLAKEANAITITDNGRGIPVDRHKKYKKSALELIMTTLHAGGKFGHENYLRSGGLHGVGASVVNALSKHMKVTVRRDGDEWYQLYGRGKPKTAVKRTGVAASGHGTEITFSPDPEIFSMTRFNPTLLKDTLEAKAYLHKGLRITFKDKTSRETFLFHHEEGISAYLEKQLQAKKAEPVKEFIFYSENKIDPLFEVALAWTEERSEFIQSFVNGIRTHSGGTHEQGLRSGIVRAVRNYMETHGITPKGISITAEDIREGIASIFSVFLPDPQFQGQTKERLNNPECQSQITSSIAASLERYFNENRSIGDTIVVRITTAARARLASRTAQEQVKRKSAVSHRLNLPGKLADCSSTTPAKSELFIVEGDSAGGTAKTGRDRKYQAILPLRGKILNTETATARKMLANQQINDLITAIGCGIGKSFDLSRLRYHKVIILTDADSDGHHIATLLLTFFYRHAPNLIRNGHLYIGDVPLYRICIGNDVFMARTDEEKERILKKNKGPKKATITRFKGLGEMSSGQLKEVAMDRRTRSLLKVVLDDELLADRTIADLMGKDVAPRFKLVMEESVEEEALDL